MEERDLDINGTTLHCRTWGEQRGDREAILLVHGLTSSSQAWAQLGPTLAQQGFFALAPDLRGRGRSGKPDHGYGIPFHANDLLSLGDAFGIPAMHVVGHSFGALIGLYLSAIYPERAARLVMIDAAGEFPPDTVQAIAASLSRLDSVYPSLQDYLAAMQSLPLHPWNEQWERYYRYDALVHADGTVTSRVPRAAIDEELRVLATLRLDELPTMVRAPTLILRATVGLLGPDRGLLLPAALAERAVAALSRGRLVEIPGTNHYTIIIAPQVEHAVVQFLTEGRSGEAVSSTKT